ncbi:MAG: protein-L-isoaspartate O-methyltransferase [Caulobacterales bacterium]
MLTLRRAGVSDARVLAAFDSCKRAAFLEPGVADLAEEDVAIPLACGQTSLKPSGLAAMLEALNLEPENRVLLIGAGAGYSTAIAARIAREVVALERYKTLTALAAANLARDGLAYVRVIQADGLAAFEDGALFDRILLTGAVTALPPTLLNHLTPGGVLVAPVLETEGGAATVQRWEGAAHTALVGIEADRLEPGLPQHL